MENVIINFKIWKNFILNQITISEAALFRQRLKGYTLALSISTSEIPAMQQVYYSFFEGRNKGPASVFGHIHLSRCLSL
jgi:hypothetical protein